ncbi:DeoR/GlpR family DNA-binding transcription regulator [Corynebacterium sp.]|uniref:DeoR/GlpR family DNA-binding transcription regulator n=1 Tax=Corynebacterium sp. TaxID=1720 RepID=UPI002A91D343|nr:DeoR/GlpR family DNA-binding transcription regulator [Corynebacterium sp.]MDY5785980.1 DeoR/GlpR family DNA-binding transcription regulator [Corynebacterium sp.]
MYADERRRQIASLTAVAGRVSVTELAERYDVTAETIRRDLAVLSAEGVIHRVHGGAVASQAYLSAEVPLDARYRSASGAKTAIARAALDFIPDKPEGGIFLDSGTTISMLASQLVDHPGADDLPIVTNSLPIALELSSEGLTNVQLLGGKVRALSQAVVGDTALRSLALMTADVAFIGTNALTVDHGLSTAHAQEAAVKAAMVTNASKVVVLCDSSKLGNDYVVNFATLDDIDVLVTDAGAPPSIVERFEDHGIEVVLAAP